MPMYAHIKDGKVFRRFELSDAEAADIPVHKRSYIVPIVEPAAAPVYNEVTHHAPISSEGVEPDRVVTNWSVPVAKTQAELIMNIDQAKERKLDAMGDGNVRMLHDINNRILMLEGKPTLSLVQFRAYRKTKI